jgi:SAM-dependent methyltransferase
MLKNGSDLNVDYTQKVLPWISNSFDVVVSQHLVEHLELTQELIPLLKELNRVLKIKGEIWLSCPDLKKVCESYLNHKMKDLLDDRCKRFPYYSLGEIPSQYMINDFFHQYANNNNPYGFRSLDWREGAHKNLYDFEILYWALSEADFTNILEVSERDFLQCFPNFPARNDEMQTIYIKAIVM